MRWLGRLGPMALHESSGLPDLSGLRIGLFGGAFDPPHMGHLVAAQAVREALDLDRVLLVPAALSPFKQEVGPRTPGEVRLRMMVAAVQEDPYLDVLSWEVEQGGVSYTVDTLRKLASAGAKALYLSIGADQWKAFAAWKEPEEIARRATLVVMTREGESGPRRLLALPDLPEPTRVDVPRIDLSSTWIRARIREGRSIRYLVPEPVRRIVEDTGLYLEGS